MTGDAKLNDMDLGMFLFLVVITVTVGFGGGHHMGYQNGLQEAQQDDQTAYVTCSTINESSTMCFTSGDVEFEWMHEANTTTRNGTMQLRAINEGVDG